MDSIRLKIWAHSITSVLFFVYLWHLSVYWYAVHPIHLSKMTEKNTRMIDYQAKLNTYPPAFLVLNFLMTDWTFMRRHAQYAVGAFVIYQGYIYRRNLSHTKEGFFRNYFTEEGLLDTIIFVGFVAVLYMVSMFFVRLSEMLKGRMVEKMPDPIDRELTKRQKSSQAKRATPTWTEKNVSKKKKNQ